MATGNWIALLLPNAVEPTSSAAATIDTRNAHPVIAFDATTDEEAMWTLGLPDFYSGGGLTVVTYWMAASATSGAIRVQTDIERMDVGTTDFDADSFTGTFQSSGATVAGTSGVIFTITTTHSSGANMDSAASGDLMRLKVRRDADGTSGTDDATGDGHLVAVLVKET